jgi:hypothetical protein
MLRLNGEQMAALGADARETYEARMTAEMIARHPERDERDISARVSARVSAAVAQGVTDEAAVTRYVRTTFALEPVPAPTRPTATSRSRDPREGSTSPSSRSVGSAVQSCQSWVAIELVDEDDGHPIPNQPFTLELPDGTKRSGITGGDGKALFVGVPSGTCNVTFPRMPKVQKA